MNKTEVHIWDLPEERVYVNLYPNFKKKIFLFAKGSVSWNKLAEKLNITYKNLSGIIYDNKKIKLKVLNKLINLTETSKQEVEKNISILSLKTNSSIKHSNAIINPKLPFNFKTTEGIRVIASIFFDGGIDSDFKPFYTNENIHLRKKVYESYTTVFGEFISKSSNYIKKEQFYFPKIVGIILTNGLGLTAGRKTITNPKIPFFIMNGPQELKATFLQQAYDDEGHVHVNNKSIAFKLANGLFIDKSKHKIVIYNNIQEYAPNLIKGVKKLFESFNIKTSSLKCVNTYQTKDGRYNTRWTFRISRKENLEIFKNEINFNLNYKKNDLKKILNSYKEEHYPKNKSAEIIYNACKTLQEKEGKIMSRTLAKEINRSQTRAKKAIQKLVRDRSLRILNERWGIKGAEYILE